jgi:CRP/FNR family cyclic AMP-dependent transcriptional regulator
MPNVHGDAGGNAVKPDSRRSNVRKMQLFEGISDQGLVKVEAGSCTMSFKQGEQILSQAGQSGHVFVVLSGQCVVTLFAASGKSVSFRRIDPGGFFGEFAAIDGQPRSAVVEAGCACQVLELNGPLFMELIHTEPAFCDKVLMHLTGQLRDMTARIFEFSTLAVKNRIQAELVRMAKPGLGENGAAVINPAPTHTEIANRISTHREAVSREMSRLTRLGILKRDGKSLIVTGYARLEQMVEDACCE